MANYKLSNVVKEDLIRIHHYGVKRFGIKQADKYFESFFVHFDLIAENPQSFESVDFIKLGYRRCISIQKVGFETQIGIIKHIPLPPSIRLS